MTSTSYRGRHRAPRKTGLRVTLLGVFTVGALSFGVPGVASADTLEVIAQCESGGRNAKNPSSSASGYYQIIDGTWKANGGKQFASTARGASKGQQRIVAERVMASQGPGAWSPSAHCWKGKKSTAKKKVAEAKAPKKTVVTQPKRKAAPPLKAAGERVVRKIATEDYLIKSGDTLSRLAKSKGTTVRELLKLNPGISNPNRIIAGHRLNV